MFYKRTSAILFSVVTAIGFLWLGTLVQANASPAAHRSGDDAALPTLRINEFMANNQGAYKDPLDPENYPDWIEIYNFGENPVNMLGHYLSNDIGNLTQWQITMPHVLEPNKFFLFIADSDPSEGPFYTNFELSESGDSLYIVAPDGETIISQYQFDAQNVNVSHGICSSPADKWGFFFIGTPNSGNRNCGPEIGAITAYPEQPDDVDSVSVGAEIIDDGDVMGADLVYRVQDGDWLTTPMTLSMGSRYTGTIPPQAAAALVEYFVIAEDDEGFRTTNPTNTDIDLYTYTVTYIAPQLILNEFMADNHSTLAAPDNPELFPDWIELYNPTLEAIDLQNLYFTTVLSDSRQFQITQSLVISAGGYLILYADSAETQEARQLGFNLDATGGYIGIFGLDGRSLIDSYEFGPQMPDVSEGLLADADGNRAMQILVCASPGAANDSCTPPNRIIYLPILSR